MAVVGGFHKDLALHAYSALPGEVVGVGRPPAIVVHLTGETAEPSNHTMRHTPPR